MKAFSLNSIGLAGASRLDLTGVAFEKLITEMPCFGRDGNSFTSGGKLFYLDLKDLDP